MWMCDIVLQRQHTVDCKVNSNYLRLVYIRYVLDLSTSLSIITKSIQFLSHQNDIQFHYLFRLTSYRSIDCQIAIYRFPFTVSNFKERNWGRKIDRKLIVLLYIDEEQNETDICMFCGLRSLFFVLILCVHIAMTILSYPNSPRMIKRIWR